MKQDPTLPAPRLHDEDWMSLQDWEQRHLALKQRAAQGGVDLLFLGDSITEAWPLEGAAAWQAHFEPLKAAAFGIGGDQTQHLLWRFQRGEFDGLNPKAVVLLIGTNNFGHQDDEASAVFRGIQAIVAVIRQRWPQTRLLLHGVLPCGETAADPRRAKVAALNQSLAAYSAAEGLAYWDATELFMDPQGRLNLTLLPDALHPNALAYERWAQALSPPVLALLH